MPEPDTPPAEGPRKIASKVKRKYNESAPGEEPHSAVTARVVRSLANRPLRAPKEDTAEVTALKKTLQDAASEVEVGAAMAKKQIAALQTQWKTTREELEAQKLARSADAARMATMFSDLEGQLDFVTTRAASESVTLSKERNLWRGLASAAGVIAVALVCVMLWWITSISSAPLSSGRQSPPGPSTPAATASVLPLDAAAELSHALDNLDYALATVPGITAEAALRKVSTPGKGCMVVWVDDQPSLVFGGEPVRPNTLAKTLSGCADAVTRLH